MIGNIWRSFGGVVPHGKGGKERINVVMIGRAEIKKIKETFYTRLNQFEGKFIIYGAGVHAELTRDYLRRTGLERKFECYCVSDVKNVVRESVKAFEDIADYKDHHMVLVPNGVYATEMIEMLENNGWDTNHYVLVPYTIIFNDDMDIKEAIESYLAEHPGTTFACFNTPFFPEENLTENEQFIKKNDLSLSRILEDLDKENYALDSYYEKKDILEMLDLPLCYQDTDGIRHMVDRKGKCVNILKGQRLTELQPQQAKRNIFLIGGQSVFGVGTSDAKTIASYLQELLNQYLPDEEIVVHNYGQFFDREMYWNEIQAILDTLPLCPQGGDVILWNRTSIVGIPYIDMTCAATLPRDCELFFDKIHYTPDGYKLIADRLFYGLIEHALFSTEYLQDIRRFDYLPFIKEKGLSVSDLRAEECCLKYLKKLKEFAKKYTVIIASHVSAGTSKELAEALMSVGLRMNLCEKQSYAYAAVIDSGEIIFEELSPTLQEAVEFSANLGGNQIKLRGWGYEAQSKERGAWIEINHKLEIFVVGSGLYFVVYDKEHQMVLDSVNFDNTVESLYCFRLSSRIEKVKKYQKMHPGVTIASFAVPVFPVKPITENEKFIKENMTSSWAMANDVNNMDCVLNKYFSKEERAEVMAVPTSYFDINGVRRFEDIQGKLVNIVGGHRITKFQPSKPKRTIFIVGGCHVFGVGVGDDQTMESRLQELVNQRCPEEEIIVQNYGYFLNGVIKNKGPVDELPLILNALPAKSGDIVLLDAYLPNITFFNMQDAALNPQRNYDVFFDDAHFTPDGYKLIANLFYKEIVRYNLLSKAKEAERESRKMPENFSKGYGLDSNNVSELAKYKAELMGLYEQLWRTKVGAAENLVIGAIVMNCNPFTLGHRYLIEQASSQCDYLVIFVVQEDKSNFPFADRIRLVREGVADISNVITIPSGRFIISSLTFSDYFNKSELQERVVDTSMDVLLFAREIAPYLHITKRFAGEEPFDNVTRQYNESMKKILPEYGIKFVEIPRKCIGDEVISASYVRKLLNEKKYETIRKLVPDTTFCYLQREFND